MTSLAGKVALVTGASRGIGSATAERLAALGARVALNYNSSPTPALELESRLRATGATAMAVKADVADADQTHAMLETVTTEFGPIDILINNAGFVRDRLLLRMSDDDWNDVWSTDFAGSSRLARELAPEMASRGWGRVINVASVVGIAGNAGQANYAAAKGAVIGLTRDLATGLAPNGVTVNCVAPGYINTDATSGLADAHREAWLKQIPAGRWGDATEVAGLIAYLAGPEASYITGQCIVIDGGLLTAR